MILQTFVRLSHTNHNFHENTIVMLLLFVAIVVIVDMIIISIIIAKISVLFLRNVYVHRSKYKIKYTLLERLATEICIR